MKGYTAVLSILLSVFVGMLFLRTDVQAVILRLPGQLFQHKGDKISNVYTYKIVNKTMKDYNDIHFELIDQKGEIKNVGKQHFKVSKEAMSQGTLFIEIEEVLLESDKTNVKIGVYNGTKLLQTTKNKFFRTTKF